MMMNAIAVHCVANVGFGRAIITVKISIEIPSTTADQSMIARLPNVSIVPGVTDDHLNKCSILKGWCDSQYVPMAKQVFMIATSSWDMNEVKPIFANMQSAEVDEHVDT